MQALRERGVEHAHGLVRCHAELGLVLDLVALHRAVEQIVGPTSSPLAPRDGHSFTAQALLPHRVVALIPALEHRALARREVCVEPARIPDVDLADVPVIDAKAER
ncbi:MAG TPA: hypothetical protein VFS15_15115, partial [Kofleriaceae bacterium]|nr:hypothetical protein [Kofleriaceae bacterium]